MTLTCVKLITKRKGRKKKKKTLVSQHINEIKFRQVIKVLGQGRAGLSSELRYTWTKKEVNVVRLGTVTQRGRERVARGPPYRG